MNRFLATLTAILAVGTAFAQTPAGTKLADEANAAESGIPAATVTSKLQEYALI